MKIHYINILLFELPLNILIYNQRNHYITRTPKATTRTLCECELYELANYDNDPQMKEVMQDFDRQTSQRFEEYDERMKTTRQKCKDKCDKEIQKIILKDKLEKELMDKFATLQTDIQNDAIPTCVCEKSLADKVEKTCLRCGSVFGGGIAPSVGLLGGIGEAAISVLKPAAITAAEQAAVTEAIALATQEGMKAVLSNIEVLIRTWGERAFVLRKVATSSNYKCGAALLENAEKLLGETCKFIPRQRTSDFCNSVIHYGGEKTFNGYAKAGSDAFEKTLASQTTTLTEAKVGAVEATYGGYHISIIASIVAIVVIVLIMVIIYLILRYRRKKKMKKKLQYIKLLEE
ncbi:rifin [Plasmodium falciparum IGH-CR14]|uniref:Rifin n=1 Tax=Plasmodium falciparum IGH-CR14 TaxID=580059 RepID=A0A0L1I5B2_PLAFA|nr:rifin [Plasmodium falciparum IGH-CR14]